MTGWATLACLLLIVDTLVAGVIFLLDLLYNTGPTQALVKESLSQPAETAHRLSTVLFEPLDGLFSFYEPTAHPAQPHRRRA